VAVEEMMENRTTQFDPQVVEALLRVLGYDGSAEVERAAGAVA
jgi:HD-GYP domain-containing protein (c-di-GMP phosphodiesterase class II)